jgi:hypothetical protein
MTETKNHQDSKEHSGRLCTSNCYNSTLTVPHWRKTISRYSVCWNLTLLFTQSQGILHYISIIYSQTDKAIIWSAMMRNQYSTFACKNIFRHRNSHLKSTKVKNIFELTFQAVTLSFTKTCPHQSQFNGYSYKSFLPIKIRDEDYELKYTIHYHEKYTCIKNGRTLT